MKLFLIKDVGKVKAVRRLEEFKLFSQATSRHDNRVLVNESLIQRVIYLLAIYALLVE